LEAKRNYIPSSDRTRKEYTHVLLKEYRKYVEGRADNTPKQSIRPEIGQDGHGRKGVL